MALARLLSSLVLVLAGHVAVAHEVLPSIADMTQTDGLLDFEIRLNLESFVAGIDMTAVTDTNAAPEAASYDELRAMDPTAFEAAFLQFWPQMADQITVRVDGVDQQVTLKGVTIPAVGDVAVIRASNLQFSAPVPEGGKSVQVGWASKFGTLVIRQQGVDQPYDGFLEAGALSDPITLAGGDQAGPVATFFNYIPVGFDHIVPKGLDHILFVLGLFFLSTQLGPLLWQVSAFTVAHTITLALAALGYVSVPAAIVEPLIAASIVFVAVENIVLHGLSPWRPFIVFGFGLLHGLGFASVLGQFGLPPGAFVPALIGFNIGVELGQLFVISIAFFCIWQAVRVDEGANEQGRAKWLYAALAVVAAGLALLAWQTGGVVDDVPLYVFLGPMAALFVLCWISVKNRDQIEAFRRIVATPASVAIAIVGAYWFVQRVFF